MTDTRCTIPHTVRRQDGSTFLVYSPDWSIPGMAEAVAAENEAAEIAQSTSPVDLVYRLKQAARRLKRNQ